MGRGNDGGRQASESMELDSRMAYPKSGSFRHNAFIGQAIPPLPFWSKYEHRRHSMKIRHAAWFLLLASLGFAQSSTTTGEAAFQKLSALVGDWQGSYEWTGARHDGGKMNVHYYLTGNGSALVEDLSTGDTPSMTTVYHLDNGDLRLTHYCAARNQPRLKATKIDLGKGTMEFTFVDVTNVPSLAAPFVHGLDVKVANADQLELTFHFESAGKKSDEHISLKRMSAKT
jgi:hypothetical protein